MEPFRERLFLTDETFASGAHTKLWDGVRLDDTQERAATLVARFRRTSTMLELRRHAALALLELN